MSAAHPTRPRRAPADGHTRLVGLAKIALPVAGVALLSGLFLLSGGPEREAIPSAEAEGAAREGRLGAPVHAGVSEGGDAVEVSADVARPRAADPRRIDAERLRARIRTPAGTLIDLRAPRGRIDTRAGIARLEGGLTVATSTGLAARTEAMTLDLGGGRAVSDGAVEGAATFGDLDAGGLVIEGERARFAEGVRLVFLPGED